MNHHSETKSRRTKRSKTAIFVGLALASMLSLAASDAFAQGQRRGKGHGRAGLGPRLGPAVMSQLELSEQQRGQIQTLRREMREELSEEREQLNQLRTQMRAAWNAEQPNEQTIIDLHRQMQTLRGVVQERQIRFRLAVHSVLTPEQRTQLRELARERRQGRRNLLGNQRHRRGRSLQGGNLVRVN